MTQAAVLIYSTRKSTTEEQLGQALSRAAQTPGIEVDEVEIGAVVGELAGIATQVLLSQPVQALVNAIEIGAACWAVIRAARAAGKEVVVSKPAVPALVAATIKEDHGRELEREESEFKAAVVWGPMEARPLSGVDDSAFVHDGASIPTLYLTAVAIPRSRNRVRTYWYLIGEGGTVASSWWTQTLRDRIPEFLRPAG